MTNDQQHARRARAHRLGTVVLLSSALGVAGCTSDGAEPDPPVSLTSSTEPSPTTPAAPSPDEIAAQATSEAVVAYYSMLTLLLNDPTTDLNRPAEVAQGTAIDEMRTIVIATRDQQQVATGDFVIASQRVLDLDPEAEGGAAVAQVEVCLDVSNTDLLDANGVSVVPPDRELRTIETLGLVSRDASLEGPLFVDTVDSQGVPC